MSNHNNSLEETRAEKMSEKGWRKVVLMTGEDYIRGLIGLAIVYVLWKAYLSVSVEIEQLSGLSNRYILLIILFVPVLLGWSLRKFFYPFMKRFRTLRSVLRGEERFIKEFSMDERKGFPVALVNWPTEEVRAYCVIAATYPGIRQNQELATVFIPKTPDVTKGYLRVVSLDELEIIDWTLAECMRLHVTYGSQSPSKLVRHNESRPEESQV